MSAKRNDGPIFVVGTPRSGTSILTWCLGQHANILPQEESGWLGEFAVSLGVHFKTGTECGARSQLTSLGIDDASFFQTFGSCVNTMILSHRLRQEQVSKELGRADPSQINPAFCVSRSAEEPKLRWVDGTPEYSYYIAGLRKLFPDAKFVHIVRNVRCVVDSMLNFSMGNGRKLVETEQQAYEYWLGTVQACLHAESAYGPEVIHRLRYEDLLQRPEEAIRNVLSFLNEPYMDACLQPLASKINSSHVPAGFDAREFRSDRHVLERAWRLSDQLQQSEPDLLARKEALALVEGAFSRRIVFMAELGAMYAAAQRKVSILTRRLNGCGAGLAANFLLSSAALCALWSEDGATMNAITTWFLTSSIGIVGYLAIRRAGLREHAAALLRPYRWRSRITRPISADHPKPPFA